MFIHADDLTGVEYLNAGAHARLYFQSFQFGANLRLVTHQANLALVFACCVHAPANNLARSIVPAHGVDDDWQYCGHAAN
jgi:hypothetical protein